MSQKKNSLYNIIGLGIPLIVGIVVIPILISQLGESKFGILTLIWALIGYFSVFDLGLGRSLTLNLSRALSKNYFKIIGPIFYTSCISIFFISLILSIFIFFSFIFLSSFYFTDFFVSNEISNSVYIITIFLPLIILIAALRGTLESLDLFGIINFIRLPTGVLTFTAPLISIYFFGSRMDMIVLSLIIVKLISFSFYLFFSLTKLREFEPKYLFKKRLLNPLIYTGGWMTVSNLVSPLMGYLDRFILAYLISTAAVAYYVTPFEIVSKIWIIPGSLTLTLFPFFSFNSEKKNSTELIRMFKKSSYTIFLIVFPISLFFAFFSTEILSIWINEEFSIKSSLLLKIFSFGIFFNCLVHIPFTLLQASGFSKATAIIHTAQLPIFVFFLFLLTNIYGLIGTAIAWILRMFIDAFLMYYFCFKRLNWDPYKFLNYRLIFLILISITLFYLSHLNLIIFKLVLLLICMLFSVLQLRKIIFNEKS